MSSEMGIYLSYLHNVELRISTRLIPYGEYFEKIYRESRKE